MRRHTNKARTYISSMDQSAWGRSSFSELLPVSKRTKLGEQHVIGSFVLGVVFKHRSLKVLNRVWPAIEVRNLDKFIRNGVALLHQAAVRAPILPEKSTHPMA